MGIIKINFNKHFKVCQVLGLVIFVLLFPFLVQAKCEEGQIDINTASLEELDKIMHIGPSRAEQIIALRQFESLDDLTKVKGISTSRVEDIKNEGLACVDVGAGLAPAQEDVGVQFIEPKKKQKAINQPPIAKAGNDIIGLVNKEINFDASQSSDPDNEQLSFFWNFGDGFTSDEIKPSHFYSYPGNYFVSLEVNDSQLSSTDTLEVKIYPSNIVISEFMPDEQWIEIFNQNEYVVDISGFFLDTFQFPQGSLIGPKQFLVLPKEITGGKVRLLYPERNVAYEVSFLDAPKGQSSNWSEKEFFWSTIPTPGLPNIISTESPKNPNLSSLIKETSYASLASPTIYLENAPDLETTESIDQKIAFLESRGRVTLPLPAAGQTIKETASSKPIPLFTVICFGIALILLTVLVVKCYYRMV